MDKKSVSIMTALCLLIFVLFGIIVIDSQIPSDEYADIKADIQKAASHEASVKHETAKPEKHVETAVVKKEATCPAKKKATCPAHKKATCPAKKGATCPAKEAHQEESHAKAADAPKKEAPAAASDLSGAKTEVADVIMMNNPAYAKHKKGIATFTHKAHVEDYEISCGECHHDSNGKPLTLKMGDPVQNCIACHSIPSRKTKDAKTQEAKLKFHAEAIHMNCIGCHKAYNKEHGTKAAPSSCGKCHPKNK